jgi:hypothetical protein
MSKSAGEINRNRYQSLDAMRGLAAIAVAAGHFNSSYVHSSYLAVDFFFILSGFVIGNAYASKLNGGMTPVVFMWVRLVRLRGKKGLSMAMVQRLRARFRVPADLLLPPPKKPPRAVCKMHQSTTNSKAVGESLHRPRRTVYGP